MANIVKLEDLIARPAGGVLSDAPSQPDGALLAEGWERRFTADVERVAEVIGLYARLGFEVRAEPLWANEVTGECQGCHSATAQQFKTIYTRRKKQ